MLECKHIVCTYYEEDNMICLYSDFSAVGPLFICYDLLSRIFDIISLLRVRVGKVQPL